jgi:hypothetical protein
MAGAAGGRRPAAGLADYASAALALATESARAAATRDPSSAAVYRWDEIHPIRRPVSLLGWDGRPGAYDGQFLVLRAMQWAH